MIITLVGMSNLGKSYWADRLVSECGFEKIDCDALIEAKLGAQLQERDVATWMGFPFDPHYPAHSRESLRCEREVMLEIVAKLRDVQSDRPLVIDTSGSVDLSGEDVLLALKELSTVVYLEASLEHRQQLFAKYLSEPKPVIWGGGTYSPHADESPRDALMRCYPNLLRARAECYAEVADRTVPYEQHRDPQSCALDLFPFLNVGLAVNEISTAPELRERPCGIARP